MEDGGHDEGPLGLSRGFVKWILRPVPRTCAALGDRKVGEVASDPLGAGLPGTVVWPRSWLAFGVMAYGVIGVTGSGEAGRDGTVLRPSRLNKLLFLVGLLCNAPVALGVVFAVSTRLASDPSLLLR